MSGDLNRRIGKLTSLYGTRGCDTCRPWHTTRVEIVPANVAPIDPPPAPVRCPACGRTIPSLTNTIRIVMPPAGDDPEYMADA